VVTISITGKITVCSHDFPFRAAYITLKIFPPLPIKILDKEVYGMIHKNKDKPVLEERRNEGKRMAINQ
jgi:hypothetical protein